MRALSKLGSNEEFVPAGKYRSTVTVNIIGGNVDMRWTVKEVDVMDGYRLHITFEDGKAGIVDMSEHLHKPYYRALKDKTFFSRAKAKYGTVIWDDKVDVAPEFLYENCI